MNCVQLRPHKRLYAYMKICARYWFLSVRIIWICQCVWLFFLPCAWLPPPLVHCVAILAQLLRCADFFCLFVCCFFLFFFYCLLLWELIFSPCIKQASFSQSKGWFPLLPTRAINCENCQLFLSTSIINLTQSRTIKLEENKNNHILSVFNFQQSISESLQP